MAPRTTGLGEIITCDSLGNYYLREIILRRARSLASLQPSFKFSAQHPFYLYRLYLFMSLQTIKKKKGAVLAYIHRKQSKHSILIFRGQYKERSLQKNAKTGRLILKKKGNTKIKSLKAKP